MAFFYARCSAKEGFISLLICEVVQKEKKKQLQDSFTQTEYDSAAILASQEERGREIEKLQESIQQLRVSLADTISSTDEMVKEKQTKIDELNEQLNERQSTIDELQIACERLKSQGESLSNELAKYIQKEQERLASEAAASESSTTEKAPEEAIPTEKEQSPIVRQVCLVTSCSECSVKR